MQPLIVKADFKDYADLSESLDMDRLRPHILAAQLNRLRPILTEPLFNELLRLNEAATPQVPLQAPWADLRAKAVPVVANAAMARYTPFSPITQTAFGPRVKDAKDSQAADGRDLARQANIYDGDALTHEVLLADWLKTHGKEFGSFYPTATGCGAAEVSRAPSVVVQAIRRPNDRPASSIPYGH